MTARQSAPGPTQKKALSPTARKVKLMKLKMKAKGDKGLPVVERFHLAVRTPDGQETPFFFSKVPKRDRRAAPRANMRYRRFPSNQKTRSNLNAMVFNAWMDREQFEDLSENLSVTLESLHEL